MLFEAVKSEVVSHISYIVGSKNEAAVIDPRRDSQIYSDVATKWGARIKYIFETHRNEDYVTGSLELSNVTGATVFHGPGLKWRFGETVKDKQEFIIGLLKIKALHTPGHSPESTSYALYHSESGDQAVMVFTGDTLFVGEVGRTDFLGHKMTPLMSRKMYDSIMKRLLPLGEGVIVCPAHGAGSVCGGKVSEREISTLGIERATNPMLRLSEKEFVAYKVAEKHQTPPYFRKMEEYNLEGPPILGALPSPRALKPSEFNEKAKNGAFIVDVRSPVAFGGAHIKGSYSLPPSRISNAGWVLTYDRPILLIAENPEALDFAVRNLVRLGFDRIKGYLTGGLEAWYKEGMPIAKVELLTVQDLRKRVASKEDIVIVDVRRENEWNEGHIEGSRRIYVGKLEKEANSLPRHSPIILICKTGNRSSFGASVLLRAGFDRVHNCLGGIDAWTKLGYPLVK
jgi:hydroxyacylglutathione hydrolase